MKDSKISSVYDLEICDCHHHLWDLSALRYGWLSDDREKEGRVCGDYEAICYKNFLIEDFQRNRGGLNVTRLVHEEAVVDRVDAVAETRWLQGVAEAEGSEGAPHGIVAFADFSAADIERILEAHCVYPNMRGIRQFVHEAYIDPLNPGTSLLESERWRESVGLCERFGLSFDLQLYWQQAAEAETLLKRHPSLSFVITHCLLPAEGGAAYFREWKRAIDRLSQFENASIKLSGFGMFDRNWSADTIREKVLAIIEAFGVERCAFASNFPVDSLARHSYVSLWENYYDAVEDFSDDEKRALFGGTGRRLYRV